MPLTLTERYQLAHNPDFIERVMIAAIDAAVDTSSEATSGDPETDANRIQFAQDMVRRPRELAEKVSYAVVTRTAIITDANPTDVKIKQAVLLCWNTFAGLNPNAAESPS